MFSRLSRALIASIVVLLPAAVLAQAYPTKPIRLIVPFAPGGTNDILARMIATHLSQKLGENMIVDNRPGFQGVIGTDLAVKAAPDGYTLLMVSSAYTMNPVLVKLPYDPLRALEFVAKIEASFLVLSVGPSLPVNSVKDLLATARDRPGEIARYFTSPEMQKQMTAMGAVIDLKTPDEMRKIIPVVIAKWTKVAIDAGMPRADM